MSESFATNLVEDAIRPCHERMLTRPKGDESLGGDGSNDDSRVPSGAHQRRTGRACQPAEKNEGDGSAFSVCVPNIVPNVALVYLTSRCYSACSSDSAWLVSLDIDLKYRRKT